MDMSLDDYINSFTKLDTNNQRNGFTDICESNFKEGRREPKDEDEELDTQCQTDDYVSLAVNNDERALVKLEPNDLRNKIGLLPSANSQQWRLMRPNIMHTRPVGMPPLIPSDLPEHSFSGNRGNWRNYNHRKRRNFNKNNNNSHNNNNFINNNRNNGRINRINMNNSYPNIRAKSNSNNIKLVVDQLQERKKMIQFPSERVPDQSESNVQSNGSETVKSLLGVGEIGLRNEAMPSLASKLIDFLNGVNTTSHKPQYDMKIQKEIHEIQKKPLFYKCPGGEVVSSDGVGIPDCRIHPKASGVSLNNRFA